MLSRIVAILIAATRCALRAGLMVITLPLRPFAGVGPKIAAPPAGLKSSLAREAADVEHTAVLESDLAGLKLWAADVLVGRSIDYGRYGLSAKLAAFVGLLSQDDAKAIATAPARLRGHITGRALIRNLPPVGSATEVAEWRRVRRTAVRRTALRQSGTAMDFVSAPERPQFTP